MTREQAIRAAVWIAWPAFDRRKAERDATAIGPLKAIGRQRRFVKLVRASFAARQRRSSLMGWSLA